MALIVPDFAPSKASRGEKRLFKILRDELPDDYHVWYEHNIKGLYPDFIILGPTLGLLIIEVKGWTASQILRASHQTFKIEQHNGKIEHQQSPLRQGKGYLDALLNKLKGYSILCQDDGDYQGKLTFPIGVGAVMTNITEAQARDENIYSILEKPQTAYQDELLAWDGIGERALIKRLEDMFTVRFKFWGLEEDQISTIKGIIHPEVAIRRESATVKSIPSGCTLKPDATIIKTLDSTQEQLARSIGSGHRLFCGVAGSGKTLILLSRAKTLAGELFDKRVLILCFNITLAAYLRSLITAENNLLYQERIEVLHFHDWAKSLLGSLPNPRLFDSSHEYDETIGDRLLNSLSLIPVEQKWDAVLVDEAHTFHPNWFRCCAAALKDPENGDLFIVSDRSQSLYNRQKFTWKAVGIKAQGRVKKLYQNYRNTQEILSAAWELVQPSSIEDNDDDTFPLVEPSAALRRGKRPTLQLCTSRKAEVERAISQIQRLITEGYQTQEIAVIYRYLGRCETASFNLLTQQLDELGLGCYWVNQDKKNYSSRSPGIRLITAKSALGLEFKAAIIIWVQQFGVGDTAAARRELYVSMTRAQDVLYLFGSGRFSILQELKDSEGFDVAS